MASHTTAKIKAFVERPKPKLDTTKLVTIDTDVKNSCTEITLDTLRQLQPIADPNTYPNVARYMMMVASMSPIKCICVGISPYENDILPTFAGAMAYSPVKCMGSTPSVQCLSQIMSLVAVRIKQTFVSRRPTSDRRRLPSRDEYTAKFAMMLRCSYACLSAGVVFINASPVLTSNTARKVRAASIFSEWVGRIIKVHANNQYKLTIISMGALAESSMNDVFKSYENSKHEISYTKTTNPAMLQHMNVGREMTQSPINDMVTRAEMVLDEIMGCSPNNIVMAKFDWYTYTDEVLLTIVKENAIVRLTRLLVDETPEDLLSTFLNKTISTMTDDASVMQELMSAAVGMPLGTNIAGGDNASMISGFNPAESQGMNQQSSDGIQPTVTANPFISAMEHSNSPSGNNTNQGANPNMETSQGPPMVNRRSTIGQMIDPSGKAVSHHVIVLDSMIRTLGDCMTGYKEIHKDMGELMIRQANIYVAINEGGHMNDDRMAQLDEYLESFENFCDRVMTNMEKAYGVAAAIPAVVEGDRGVYEHESQPVGPLMRRADGSTMRDYVYTEMRTNAARNEQINSATSAVTASQANISAAQGDVGNLPVYSSSAAPTSSANAVGVNPFGGVLGESNITMQITTDLSVTGSAEMFDRAKTFVYECADEMLEEGSDTESQNYMTWATIALWTSETFRGIHPEILAVKCFMPLAKGHMNVLDCISLIVTEYMSINGGIKPSEEIMSSIFETINTDDDERTGLLRILPKSVSNSTTAMQFIEALEGDDEEESSTEGSQDSDSE